VPDGGNGHVAATLVDAGFDVYDYHQVGAGLSERLADVGEYTVARHVADLEAIRAIIGADRVVLVGGSWGGQLIANYLAAHPDRVAKAVVSSPAPIWSPAFADTDGLNASGRQDQLAVIADYPRFLLAHFLLRTVGPEITHELLPGSTMDGVFQVLISQLDMWSGCPDGRHVAGTAVSDEPAGVGFWVNAMTSLDPQRIADPRRVLRNASTPVLVLLSECDYLAWEVTREYRDLHPNAVMLAIEDARHVIPSDQPALYRQAVRAFLLDERLP
jgi:proline iminopeptidase